MNRTAAINKAKSLVAKRLLERNPRRVYVEYPGSVGPYPASALVLRFLVGGDSEVGIHD